MCCIYCRIYGLDREFRWCSYGTLGVFFERAFDRYCKKFSGRAYLRGPMAFSS